MANEITAGGAADDKGANGAADDVTIDKGATGDEGGNEGDEGQGDGSDNKTRRSQETPEAKRARLQRELARHDKKYPAKGNDESHSRADKSGEFGYGEKAFLRSEGIKEADEVKLVQDYMENTGRGLEEVVDSKFFQAELKSLREDRATRNAIPQGKGRNGTQPRDSVEYWIAKGELPPPDQRELRQKVVNAKIKAQTDGNPFTNNPVIGG